MDELRPGVGSPANRSARRGKAQDTREQRIPAPEGTSEARLQALLDLSPQWYWEQDQDNRFTLIAGKSFAATGLDQAQFLGRAIWETGALPVGADSGWDAIRVQMRTDQPFADLLVRLLDPGARARFIRLSGAPSFDAEGRLLGYRGIGADVTTALRSEELLKLEHMVARCLGGAEHAMDAVSAVIRAICEAEGWHCGRYFSLDPEVGVLRFATAWHVADPMLKRFVAASRELTFAPGVGLAGRVLEHGRAIWVADVSGDPRVHAAGSHRAAQMRGALVFPIKAEDKIIGTLGLNSRDVREPDERLLETLTTIGSQIGQFLQRKQAEAALRSYRTTRDELGAMLINEAQTGLFIVQRGVIRFANPSFAQIVGRSLVEVIGSAAIDLIYPEDRPIAELQNQLRLQGQVGKPYEIRCLRKDGSVFHARVCARLIQFEGASATLVTIFDISDRVMLGKEVERKNLVLSTQQETSLDAILLVDEDNRIISYNRRFVELWNIPEDIVRGGDDAPVRQSVVQQMEDPAAFLERVKDLYGKRSAKSREELRTRDGRIIDRFTAPVVGDSGEYFGRVWYFRDVTESRRADASLRKANRTLLVLSAVHQALIRGESETRLLDTVCEVLRDPGGYEMAWIGILEHGDGSLLIRPVASSGSELPGVTWVDGETDRDPTANAARTGTLQLCTDIAADPRPIACREFAQRHGCASLAAIPLPGRDAPVGILAIYSKEAREFDAAELELLQQLAEDLAFGIATHRSHAERNRAVARADRLANFDALTELPNRALLLADMAATIRTAMGAGGFGLFSIEVPRIEEIKTSMGFGASDTLVMTIAARLSEFCQGGELAARLEGGEFALRLDPSVSNDSEWVVARAQAIRTALQQPARIGMAEIIPRCVIGIAMFPGDANEAAALLERAQTARLSTGLQSDISFYGEQASARALRELELESALRHAATNGELRLAYQPELDLHSGEIVATEALLRWNSARFGAVSPTEFIPLAERSDLILAIGDWVLREACTQAARWHAAGIKAPRIAVNLSSRQLARPDIAAHIQAIALACACDPSWLGLEITESMMIEDPSHTTGALHQLKAIGFEISIDDFGTGYSSLSRLNDMPVDIVKIDRSFVPDVTASIEDVSITRAIINMAHGLQLRVLAEGVETEGQLGLLIANGCDLIQGYYFSKPVPADEVERMVRERRRLPEKFVARVDGGRTLLLVDDEQNILSALKRLLRKDGYRILCASSAAEGLQLLAEVSIDVIVSDQRMPGMTGVEFLQRAKDLYPDTVRIVLSGFTDLQSIIDAVNEGAIYKFLMKPWDDERIRAHIAEAFRQKRLADENRRLTREVERANADLARLNEQLQTSLARQSDQANVLGHSADTAREILEGAPAVIIGVDPDGLLAFVSGAAAHAVFEAGAAIGSLATEVLPQALLDVLCQERGQATLVQAGDRSFYAVARAMQSPGQARGRLLLLLPATAAPPASAS